VQLTRVRNASLSAIADRGFAKVMQRARFGMRGPRPRVCKAGAKGKTTKRDVQRNSVCRGQSMRTAAAARRATGKIGRQSMRSTGPLMWCELSSQAHRQLRVRGNGIRWMRQPASGGSLPGRVSRRYAVQLSTSRRAAVEFGTVTLQRVVQRGHFVDREPAASVAALDGKQ